MPPSITKSAPAANALHTSAGVLQPPSAHTKPNLPSPFRKPCAAWLHSIIADNCGYPQPVFSLVVQADPGPIPILTISTPPKKNFNNDKIFLDLKLEYYLKSQNDLIVKQILDQISQDDWSDNDLINYLNHFLISDNHKLVCQ